MTRTLRLWLILGPIALVAGAGALALILVSDHTSNLVVTSILVLLGGWAFVFSGLVAWTLRPENRTGKLLVATGFAFLSISLSASNHSIPFTVGVLLGPLFVGLLVHLMVAYPTGRLEARLARGAVVAGYAAVAVFSPLSMLFNPNPNAGCDECPANALLIADKPGLNDAIQALISVGVLVIVGAAILAIVRRWRASSPAGRRSMRLALLAGGVTLGLYAAAVAVDPISHTVAVVLSIGALIGFLSVPVFFLLGLLQSRLVSAGVGRLVSELGRTNEPGAVRDALAQALHDPTLELAYRLPETGAWVDADGRFYELPAERAERTTTFVEHGGEPIAALIHDPAVRGDEPLFEAAVAAAQLALENERLQAELRSRIADLERERDFTRLVVDSTPAIFCVVDPDGRIVRFNRALERLAGILDDDEVRGRLFWDVFAVEEQAEPSRLALASAAAGLPAQPRVALLPRSAAGPALVEWIDVPIPDPSGELRFILRAGLDITERQRAVDELRMLAEEQAALRRVATAVASNPTEEELLVEVTSEVGRLFSAQTANLVRFESESRIRVMGGWSLPGETAVSTGTVYTVDGDTASALIRKTGRPARVDSYEEVDGAFAAQLREIGIRCAIAAPVAVRGELWGAITVSMTRADRSFPPGAEERLAGFTALVAQAIENAQARDEISRLAREQTALRRVATMVATEPSPEDVLESVTSEVGRLFEAQSANITRHEGDVVRVVGSWNTPGQESIAPGTPFPFSGDTATARALLTQGPSRVDSPAQVRSEEGRAVWESLGIQATIAAPIVVEGELWGAVSASRTTHREPFPEGAERRLGDFAALVAQAIANAVSRDEVRRLAEEQAALRRVATVVAAEPTELELLEVVTSEIGRLFEGQTASMERLEDDLLRVMGEWSRPGSAFLERGFTFPVAGDSTSGRALRSGKPVRIDGPDELEDETVRSLWLGAGVTSTIAAPIVVTSRVWGVISVSKTSGERFSDGAEHRLASFAALAAQGIGNAEARGQVRRLAAEQAALRRVATLVAKEPTELELLEVVTSEVGQLFHGQSASMERLEGDVLRVMGGWGTTAKSPGLEIPLEADTTTGRTLRSRRPERIDSPDEIREPIARKLWDEYGVRSTVAAPIVVNGQIWGAISVSKTTDERFSAGIERRLSDFAALTAQAIGNAEARNQVRRLAAEQAALRRVATAVAREPAPEQVLDVVTSEVGQLFNAQTTQLWRHEGENLVAVSGWQSHEGPSLIRGTAHPIDRLGAVGRVIVERKPMRIDSYGDVAGPVGEQIRASGTKSSIAAPIEVEGAFWGAIVASKLNEEKFHPNAERRLADFAALVSQAIANAQAREELNSSRARIVQATDEARRRLERNLHDGAQQRLVSLSLTLRLVTAKLQTDPLAAAEMLSAASSELAQALEELRELARGIHPAILTDRGLRPAIEALVSRVPILVRVEDLLEERLPEPVEAAAYYVVSESLANVAKYAQASAAHVRVRRENGLALVEVADDGVGGADPSLGSGLRGLADRVEALSGQLFVASEPGAGTRVIAQIPCDRPEP